MFCNGPRIDKRTNPGHAFRKSPKVFMPSTCEVMVSLPFMSKQRLAKLCEAACEGACEVRVKTHTGSTLQIPCAITSTTLQSKYLVQFNWTGAPLQIGLVINDISTSSRRACQIDWPDHQHESPSSCAPLR